jgi:hypothetical protein
MQLRRRFKQTETLEQRLFRQAAELRELAGKIAPGIERDRLIRMAREAETASRMSEWLRSLGLRRPT